MSPRDWEKKVIDLDLQKMWRNAIKVKAENKSKEVVSPENVVPKKLPGCFRFDDGTTQGWTLDQMYDHKPDPITKGLRKLDPSLYNGFVFCNSQNLAIMACANPLLVSEYAYADQVDFFFDSPDLSANANWQGISGYSLDVYRMLISGCWDNPDQFAIQMQLKLIDTTDNTLHTFGELNASGEFTAHATNYKTPYHFIWTPFKPAVDPKYKVHQLRIRVANPGSIKPMKDFAPGECAPKGKWLIGNVCPEK